MTLVIILAALAATALGFIARRAWRNGRKVVFEGMATPSTLGLEDLGARTNSRYCWLNVDGVNHLAEITPERAAKIAGSFAPVKVTLVTYPFSAKPHVESIVWAGETTKEATAEIQGDSMLLTLIYFFHGLGLIAVATSLKETASGAVALYASAYMLALAGFTLNLFHQAKVQAKEVSGRILGIPTGKGMVSLLVMFAVTCLLTVFCFGSFTFFSIFPGIHAAFATGGVVAIMTKAWLASKTIRQ